LLQEFLQGKKIALPQYNVVATHGAAHNQEFEIECLVPKLEIQVFGTGGSRRAGEQAAAKLALEAVQLALIKSPGSGRKSKPRASQLKLAGIATVQEDTPAPSPSTKSSAKQTVKTETKQEIKSTSKEEIKDVKPSVKSDGKNEAKVESKADQGASDNEGTSDSAKSSATSSKIA
jgi:ribonuclease-3